MTELWERDAWELADAVRAGELKAVDLLDGFLARVERFNEELNAFYQKVLPPDQTAARRMTYASLPALARKTNVKYEARTIVLMFEWWWYHKRTA